MELDSFINDLLHINDVENNSLLDINAKPSKTLLLSQSEFEDFGEYVTKIAHRTTGRQATAALKDSALASEQRVARVMNAFEWKCVDGSHDPKALDKYIGEVYKALSQKGNNPLFLGVGAVKWKLGGKKGKTIDAVTPLLIYPIRLVRSIETAPVAIDFVNDDVYLNPCFIAKLDKVWHSVAENFPHPNGAGVDLDDPVDLELLGDGKKYFDAVKQYISGSVQGEGTVFDFDKDFVVIAPYEHNELCMFYDIRRNRRKIDAHPLIERIFTKCAPYDVPDLASLPVQPSFVRARDSAQERIVKRVVNGESLIIKGPPGTGKTHTIINMIAALLAENKTVLLSSAKLSALSEVFNQMPAELRDFAMLLECETEAEAAKLNPSSVKKHFSDLLAKRRHVAPLPPMTGEDIRRAKKTKADACDFVDDYKAKAFGEREVLGYTYYEALDRLCAYDGEQIKFIKPSAALEVSSDELGTAVHIADRCGELIKTMTDNGANKFFSCPWTYYGQARSQFDACDKETAIKTYADVKRNASDVAARIRTAATTAGIPASKLKASVALLFAEGRLDYEGSVAALGIPEEMRKDIEAALAICDTADKSAPELPDNFDAERYATFACAKHIDPELTPADAEFMNKHRDFLNGIMDGDDVKRLFGFAEIIVEQMALIEKCETAAYRVFSRDLKSEDWEKIDKLCVKLEKFRGVEAPKPDLFSSGTYKKLVKFSYIPDIEFAEVVKAAIARIDMGAYAQKIVENERRISQLFGRALEPERLDSVLMLYKKCKALDIDFDGYMKYIGDVYPAIHACAERVELDRETAAKTTVATYAAAVYKKLGLDRLVKTLAPIFEDTVSKTRVTPSEAIAVAKNIEALFGLSDLLGGGSPEQIADHAERFKAEIVDHADKIKALFDAFISCGKALFPTYYSEHADEVTVDELDVFVKQSTDRDALNAALELNKLLDEGAGNIDLVAFFAPFIRGESAIRGDTDFAYILENSVLFAAVDGKTAQFGDWKNGVGGRVARSLGDIKESEERQQDATVATIANSLMMRINPDDRDFDFLHADKGFDTTLRRLFKNRAREILKLKKVFLLSASTASVLFNSDEFSKFDVVIVDEASQLEPVCALPVVSRGKQVVLVGDEYQMPPIHHFGGREDKEAEDEFGETVTLTGDLSVLSLALTDEAFPVEALACHFRSRTEALIAFSQKRFYPYMRTFPSAVPRAQGLGFKDVFVEEGTCDGGVNVKEAEAVVKELAAHFDTYFKDGKLTESVGIVAFGLQQIDKIIKLVGKNKALSEKIRTALNNYFDLPEKLIFYKTIETVQGQETDHLILSVTYGRSPDGKIMQKYGELNRGDLGRRIFNVAVTRAKSSVTVIHSVHPTDITGENVRYIGEYIDTAARFAESEHSVFSSVVEPPERGFVTKIADYLTSLGIDKERIVFNCGVTEGSVRVPLAVLSKDLKDAELGIWCETAPRPGSSYIDENCRYYNMLENRGWTLYRVYACDYVYNAEAERARLKAAVEKHVKM